MTGIFCDYNAGAPALPEVLEEFVAVEQRFPANPSSVHAAGRRARGELERARQRIADALGLASVDDVVFTSGGTESANTAVRGLGDPDLPVLLSEIEHPAVRAAAEQRGTTWWQDIDPTGRVRITEPEFVESSLPLGLVCLAHAQSELGTLQPVAEAAGFARRHRAPLLVDAAQTLGREPLQEIIACGAVVVLSPHKAGGLRGHGVLVGNELQRQLKPLLHGGGQEYGLRPGTQSPALAAANALAIERAVQETDARQLAMRANRDAFLTALVAAQCPHTVLTPLASSLPNTVMLCFERVDGRNLLPALDLAGVHASHGSACSSGSPTPPRILQVIGLDEERARASVRFSFSFEETLQESTEIGTRVAALLARLRQKI
ncbi:MAG: cysteine desulfurase family protein [Planctomycetota bacterium]